MAPLDKTSRPTHRALMIRRVDPANLDAVAAAFGDHDRTDLPARIGVRARTLLHYHGLYLHLIEGDRNLQDNMFASRDDPLFREIDQRMAELLTPYDPAIPSMREAQATEFYHWSSGPPPATFRVVLEFRVNGGRGEEYERTWRRLITPIFAWPDNLAQSLSRDRTDADLFYVISDWTGEEAFQRFLRSPEHRELAEASRALGDPVRVTHMYIRPDRADRLEGQAR
ncbi:TcmI family type II polyketide cyclase [Actinomadura rugatobispora]|uniref:TcmI family type II polyketide cyclase n=1 Tax=Actinomadura rugatobispora TaxID=1994 RepID=A0ABW1AC51_9ACTN|nr:hypothetical protein GCM10010200_052030 [Actinomadura rugatobispora]